MATTRPPDDARETRAWLALARRPGLDVRRARELLAVHRSADALLAALGAPPAGDDGADLGWLAAPGHRLLTASDPDYPPRLAETPGAPVALFVDGEAACLSRPVLAIVGSRAASAAGRQTAFEFAARLAADGIVVASGLAAGIDAAAHRGALAAGAATIAVCGTGLDRVYPPGHAVLARRIAAAGALVSEFAIGTPPLAANFPRRNRVLSGLALGVLVIEAAARSGSLITARLAGEQGREVMALPGSIRHPLARGCHRLIRDGAALVESPDEVRELLGIPRQADAAQATGATRNSGPRLDSAGEMLLNALGFEPADIDGLVDRTGLQAHAIASMLQLLELDGRVESLPGGRFCRVPPRQAR